MSIAERMMQLFAGFEHAHGTHGEPHQEPGTLKWKISKTADSPAGGATVKLWADHLSGKKPLGLAPIRTDGTCLWGSGDVDDYEVNALDLVDRVGRMKLPLVPCRSKSGGLHLFIFFREPVPAAQVRAYLVDVLARLGYANSEVFPKQSEVDVARGDKPNWMVMPYFGGTYNGKLAMQVGVKKTGGEQTIEEFLDFAETMKVGADALIVRVRRPTAALRNGAQNAIPVGEPDVPFGDGPPCLQHLAAGGVGPGMQNNVLLMAGIYFKKRHPADWVEHLERFNREGLNPPGSSEGVASAIRSLERKDYNYTCKTEPMKSHCNSGTCRVRRFGVGEAGTFPSLSGMAKLDTDPPIWFVNVGDSRLAVTTDQLMNYPFFLKVCLERTNQMYAALRQADWQQALIEAMRDLNLIEAPQEVGRAGVFREQLEEFLTNRQRGAEREDILRGRPWEDEKEGKHYFQLGHLQKHLSREGDRDITRPQITERIKALGGGHKALNIKKKFRNVWWVPSDLFEQHEAGDTPPVKGVPV